MADSNQTNPIGRSVPVNTTASKYHWWYDAKAAGVRNSPPANMSSSPPTSFSTSPPSAFSAPNAASLMERATAKRRDSLKNMMHLCDFATP